MKWQIHFKEKKLDCCTPKFYWVSKDTIVVADNEQQAVDKLKKDRHEIQIKNIKSI